MILGAGLLNRRSGLPNAFFIVIRARGPSSQDYVHILISLSLDNRGQSCFSDAHERMWVASGFHSINSDADTSVGPVLESNWEGDTRREFSVQLRLGGAGPDGSPRDEVGNVLR